jgi:hypothetical protein
LKRVWALAILTAIKEGDIKFEQLGGYRKHFKDSQLFKKYLKTH